MRGGADAERGARVGDQLGAGVVPLVPVACHRAREDGVDLPWQLRRVPAGGRGLLLEVREDRRDVRRASEWQLARQRLVEQAAERVHVGAAVDRIAADLLGCDVVHRAHELAVGGRTVATLCVSPKSAR